MGDSEHSVQVSFGTEVFDADGTRLGMVRGFDEHGFYVSTDEGIEALSGEHITAGPPGEGELMWRCWACGEMGDVGDLPEECPSCGAPKEDLYYWTED
jgi:hypothetical protein